MITISTSTAVGILALGAALVVAWLIVRRAPGLIRTLQAICGDVNSHVARLTIRDGENFASVVMRPHTDELQLVQDFARLEVDGGYRSPTGASGSVRQLRPVVITPQAQPNILVYGQGQPQIIQLPQQPQGQVVQVPRIGQPPAATLDPNAPADSILIVFPSPGVDYLLRPVNLQPNPPAGTQTTIFAGRAVDTNNNPVDRVQINAGQLASGQWEVVYIQGNQTSQSLRFQAP